MASRRDKKRKRGAGQDELNDSVIVSELKHRLVTLEGDLFELQDSNKKIISQIKYQKEENSRLRSEIERERARVDKAVTSINQLEQYQRTNNVRIFGLADYDARETRHQTEAKVISLLRNK